MGQQTINEDRKKELYKSIVPIADEFLKENGLGESPIQNPFEVLERLGFFILRFPANDQLSGFHIKKSGFDCIFINSAHNLGRQYFSSWHECYHAITGQAGGVSLMGQEKFDEVELSADIFAGCVMMPERLVRRYVTEKRLDKLKYASHLDIIRMQNYFNVSYTSLVIRLIQIYPDYKADLKNRFGLARLERSEEMLQKIKEAGESDTLVKPTNDFYVSERLYSLLQKNLQSDRITGSKVDDLLNFIESVKERYER